MSLTTTRRRLPPTDAVRTQAPVLTGAQVQALREKLGYTRVYLAKLLGYQGRSGGSQWLWNIERGRNGRHLDYARANLLLAIAEGYTPVGFKEDGAEEG